MSLEGGKMQKKKGILYQLKDSLEEKVATNKKRKNSKGKVTFAEECKQPQPRDTKSARTSLKDMFNTAGMDTAPVPGTPSDRAPPQQRSMTAPNVDMVPLSTGFATPVSTAWRSTKSGSIPAEAANTSSPSNTASATSVPQATAGPTHIEALLNTMTALAKDLDSIQKPQLLSGTLPLETRHALKAMALRMHLLQAGVQQLVTGSLKASGDMLESELHRCEKQVLDIVDVLVLQQSCDALTSQRDAMKNEMCELLTKINRLAERVDKRKEKLTLYRDECYRCGNSTCLAGYIVCGTWADSARPVRVALCESCGEGGEDYCKRFRRKPRHKSQPDETAPAPLFLMDCKMHHNDSLFNLPPDNDAFALSDAETEIVTDTPPQSPA